MDLPTIWFILVGLLFIGYAILDGFDLGVGALHLFAKKDEHRRILLNAIGPFWDGNEVWLVVGGGALFAAFPAVYAAVFSGFYLPFMLLLFALIFRAVAIEFRSKQPRKSWRCLWDISFSLSSMLSALLIGIVMGNLAYGVPLTANGIIQGGVLDRLHPYALLAGVTTLALFMMHGAIYTVLKTEGELQEQARAWVRNSMIFFILSYAVTTMATLLYVPHMTETIRNYPMLFIIPFLSLLAIANVPREIYHGRDFRAFLSSCVTVGGLLALFGIGMYPKLVVSSVNPEHSLTIYNTASSTQTLQIMLLMACLGMPMVAGYTVTIYWVFKGKVKLEDHSY